MMNLRKALALSASLLMLAAPARANYVVKDGNGVLQTINSESTGGAILPVMTPVDGSGNALGVSNNALFVAPGTDATFPISGSIGISGTLPGFAAPPTVLSFAANPKASITRSANTTTYSANTGWNNGAPTFFSFTGACRANGGQVLIPRIDIWSSANPTLKLAGVLWLFAGVPGTNVADGTTFTIASADFANLTGNFGGIPFTLGNAQASGASNSGTSLTGVTYQGQCAAGSTTITGMVEVTNAYVPASGEVLNVSVATVGVN